MLKPAKFAPVAPIQILEQMDHGLLGDYHLFLAHHTVEHPDRFRNVVQEYLHAGRRYRRLRIIMDNSIVELGGAVDDKMIYEATKAVADPDCQVVPCLPDVMGDMVGTFEMAEEAYHRWEALGMDRLSFCGYMLVTQAANPAEFIKLVDYFFVTNKEKYKNISWVGIPRYMLQQGWTSRLWAIRYLQMVAPHIKIHLLGFSDNIVQDMLDARELGVQGIDSAVPVRYRGELLPSTTSEEIGKRDPDWMEKGELTPAAKINIARVRQWCDYTRGYHNSI